VPDTPYPPIRKYECQLKRIADPHIAALLKRGIEDEREHVKLWEEVLAKG